MRDIYREAGFNMGAHLLPSRFIALSRHILSRLFYVLCDEGTYLIYWYGQVDVFEILTDRDYFCRGNADHIPARCYQTTAAIARVDGGVGLNIIGTRICA